jgi:hypothetical protein
MAEKRRASSTVAQVVKIALAARRMTITTVTISSTSLTGPSPGFGGPANGSESLEVRLSVAWKIRTATMAVAVTAKLAALSSVRRGRSATRRKPRSSGTGSTPLVASLRHHVQPSCRGPAVWAGRPDTVRCARSRRELGQRREAIGAAEADVAGQAPQRW